MRIRFVGFVTLALMGAAPATAEQLKLLGGAELDLRDCTMNAGAAVSVSVILPAKNEPRNLVHVLREIQR